MLKIPKLHDPIETDRMQSQPQQVPPYEQWFYTILTEAGWHFDEATNQWKCMDTFFDLRILQYYKKQGNFDAFVLCLKKVYDDQIKERGYPLDRHQKQAILCFMQRNFLR